MSDLDLSDVLTKTNLLDVLTRTNLSDVLTKTKSRVNKANMGGHIVEKGENFPPMNF